MLKRPAPSLLAVIAQGWNAVYPKDVLETKGDLKNDVVGTGPFKLKNYQRGTSIELVKNPDYHVPGRPLLDGITYYIPDQNTILSALINGQLLVWRYSIRPDIEELQRQLGDKVRITKVTDQSTHVMEINVQHKPWDDPRVRQAVSLGIDRQAAVDVVTLGEGFIAGIMAPGGKWALSHDELLKIPGYGPNKADDLARAKQLLADAGYPNDGGLKISLLTRKGPQYEPVSVFLKDQLTKLGLDATLDVRESAAFYDGTDKREFDGLGASYSTAVADPDAVFGQSWISTASRNYSGVGDRAFDELFLQQSQATDEALRRGLVHQMETQALTQVFKVVLARRAAWDIQASKVRGFTPHGSQYLSQRHEGTWLADS